MATKKTTPRPRPRESAPDRFSTPYEEQRAAALASPEVTAPLPPLRTRVQAAKAEMAARILCRRRLLPFVQRMNSMYDAGWVHEDVCRRLERFSEDVAERKSPRLMLLLPPRHGKSELASKNFPAWHLGKYPDHEFIACSYNLSLAMGFSRKVKQILDDPNYVNVFPDTKVDPNNSSTEEWGIAGRRGGYVAAGIGGPITGKGAHCLVIDDPLKNAEEADSPDIREKLWEWYLSTAYTRLSPGAGVLLIQTWWNDDDLAGRLQQAMQAHADDPDVDQFEVVRYPAIAESDEYLTEDGRLVYEPPDHAVHAGWTLVRRKGEALHPSRYGLDKLNRIRALNRRDDGTDGRWWSALYQQNPVPDDGGYFRKDMFRQAPLLEGEERAICRVFVAFDFAISTKHQNDYTVGVVGLLDPDDMLHIVDMVRFRSSDAFYMVEAVLNLASAWYSPQIVLGVEDGQIYRSLKTLLAKRMQERRMYLSVQELKPLTDKLARARAIQGRMEQGMVRFAAGAPWFETMRTELLRFPAGVHDDIVDALAWLGRMVVTAAAPRRPKPERAKSWRDKLSATGLAGSESFMSA
jgi:predicted phage terminase large subunit-like protein